MFIDLSTIRSGCYLPVITDIPPSLDIDGQSPAGKQLQLTLLAVQKHGNRRLSDSLRKFNLTLLQSDILEILFSREELNLKEIGALTLCDSGSPSRSMDQLVQRGYVDRRRDAHDRRIVHFSITSSGQSLGLKIARAMTWIDDELHDSLSDEGIENMTNALRLLLGNSSESVRLNNRLPTV
ncbi:hypothetical protein CVS29_17775 [Arthrobacter psychrochitiniphilus]|uniref:HTH marR-type domain-containing protein n=1 Tax=Arthrobacter psychrochitiniphilus TaxID=291045 RepID=A0A2V3DMB0_9MICC|nr:hypothetical protein CVS29_17775 [Arthrobacter psychrochitiniphilus]